MQSYTEIAETTNVSDSLALLLSNTKTVRSCQSGTGFPTTNLQVGMLCYRTDESKIYQLTADGPATWALVHDGNKTLLYEEDADALYSALGHGHDWTEIAGKPTSYAPSAHTHTVSEVTDAGSAAAVDTGTGDANVPTNSDLKGTARGYTKAQYSTPLAIATTTGTITIAALDRNKRTLTPTGDFALADFSDIASAVGETVTIWIDNSGGHALTGLGSAWKRAGAEGAPTIGTYGRIVADIVSATRISYIYLDEEA